MRNGRWHRVTIEENTPGATATGALTANWGEFAQAYALIIPGSSREFTAAKATNSEITHEIELRYLPGVKSTMRIKFGDRYFYLVGTPLNPGEQNRRLLCVARESE